MDPRRIGPKKGVAQEQRDTRTDEQKLKDLAGEIERNIFVHLQAAVGQVADKEEIQSDRIAELEEEVNHRSEQQDGRITELEKRCFELEGKVSDLGFRIADHDHQLNHSGITGTAKRWPVVTSQILAAMFNILVILPAAVWDILPAPWPLVIGAVLQAIAATIGGRFTESKADLARLQDGERVAPLVKVADSSRFYPGQTVRIAGPDTPNPPDPSHAQVSYHNSAKERLADTTGWRVGRP